MVLNRALTRSTYLAPRRQCVYPIFPVGRLCVHVVRFPRVRGLAVDLVSVHRELHLFPGPLPRHCLPLALRRLILAVDRHLPPRRGAPRASAHGHEGSTLPLPKTMLVPWMPLWRKCSRQVSAC